MARLENITAGANIIDITGGVSVSVVAVKWHGTNAMTVTFKNALKEETRTSTTFYGVKPTTYRLRNSGSIFAPTATSHTWRMWTY